jgi:hypothetical protein
MSYSKLSNLVKRYTAVSKFKGITKFDEIPASSKWAEYSIDEMKILELMKGVDFIEKFEAEKALTIVRRKINYMYRHPNFDLSEATSKYKKLKRLIG